MEIITQLGKRLGLFKPLLNDSLDLTVALTLRHLNRFRLFIILGKIGMLNAPGNLAL